MARTTFAMTTLAGSPALNVIASSATAGINIRVMPGDTVDDVLAHLRKVIGDDACRSPSSSAARPAPSPVDGDAFDLIESTSSSCSRTPSPRRT